MPAPLSAADFHPFDPQKARIGQLLFYDKILSGNRNISCGTCHHHDLGGSDGLALGIGEGGSGVMGQLGAVFAGDIRRRSDRATRVLLDAATDGKNQNRVNGQAEGPLRPVQRIEQQFQDWHVLLEGAEGQRPIDTVLFDLNAIRDNLRLGATNPAQSTALLPQLLSNLTRNNSRLPEPIRFLQPDGSVTEGTRRVRFGEVEQRGVAMTPAGRALYDDLLDTFESPPAESVGGAPCTHAERWSEQYEAAMPKGYTDLARQGLAYFEFIPTDKGLAASLSGTAPTALELLRQGHVALRPIVYEDFLPKSAAGIFQSNLGDDDTGQRRADAEGSDKDAAWLAGQIGFPITDPYELYAAQQHDSLVEVQRAFSLISVPTLAGALTL